MLTGKENIQFKNPEKEFHRKFTCLQIARYQSTMREKNRIERLLKKKKTPSIKDPQN